MKSKATSTLMRFRLVLCYTIAATLVGCSGSSDIVRIRGKVNYNGEPLTSGEVRYVPTGDSGKMARSKIASDGTFSLTTYDPDDGALKGEYRISVISYIEGTGGPKTREAERYQETEKLPRKRDKSGLSYLPDSNIPERYSSPETSGLSDSVNDQHSGFKQIDLSD